jgi:hypothetical protein
MPGDNLIPRPSNGLTEIPGVPAPVNSGASVGDGDERADARARVSSDAQRVKRCPGRRGHGVSGTDAARGREAKWAAWSDSVGGPKTGLAAQ